MANANLKEYSLQSLGPNAKKKSASSYLIFIFLYLFSFVLAFLIGRFPISPLELVGILISKPLNLDWGYTPQAISVVWNIRLPRVLMAGLVGAALSLSGLIMQTVFRNPMVSPDVIGSTNAAGFGAALAILMGLPAYMISPVAFLMALLSMGLVYLISLKTPRDQTLGLILGGIMIGSVFSSLTSFVKLVADPTDKLPAITYFLMGSLAGTDYRSLFLISIPIIIGSVPLFALSWRLNLLTLPEDEAKTLGVNAKALRITAITLATLLSASTVAFCGLVGWVGLVIPHITRMIIGCDTRKTVFLSPLIGASFLTIIDTISRSISSSEIPIGILTALIGSPFFLYLIAKQGRRENA